MTRRITSLVFGLILVTGVTSTQAQERVEASFNVGYSASEGITSDQRPLIGQLYDTIAIDSGASINFTVGYNFTPKATAEFLWARQNSRLQADGPGGKLPFSELAVYNYMFNFVYHLGRPDGAIRPYVFGGVGATNYAFSDILIAGGTGSIEGETRFSTNFGGGLKFYFTPKVGAKVGVRWTPTYISSENVGVWCDPFYGCWPVTENQYANQFETAGGITFRF